METGNTIVGSSNTGVCTEAIISRVALGGGAALIAGATGYMNIAGWVAQANDEASAWVNGALATGMELAAAGGLAWAAYQLGQRRPLRAAFAGAVGGMLVYFNTLAAQNFIHVQHDRGEAGISAATLNAADIAREIARHEREIAAIERRYGGAPPRPVGALSAASAGLQNTRRRDAALLRQLGAEEASRMAYDAARAEIERLREEKRDMHITAAQEVRTVMPAEMIVPFIWAMEIVKGSIFFILGGSDLSAIFRRRAAPQPQPEPASTPKQNPTQQPAQTPKDRARWARIKGGGKGRAVTPV